MQRAELRQATRAPKVSSCGVCTYVPVVSISWRTCRSRSLWDGNTSISA